MNNQTNTVSVITVVFNDCFNIEKTINSVLSQNYNIEYVVIDGASTDGTMDIINKYRDQLSVVVSEPDNGIYDAMNKGINIATGEWIIFMNSGDIFHNNSVIATIFDENISENVNFIYSDFCVNGTKTSASFQNGVLLHQSVIYRRKKHFEYGMYAVTKKYIISDYLFFLRFDVKEVYKTKVIISDNSQAGVSGGKWCVLQKLCSDFIFNRITFFKLIVKLYYWYFLFPVLHCFRRQ